jgi:hypothetical protein
MTSVDLSPRRLNAVLTAVRRRLEDDRLPKQERGDLESALMALLNARQGGAR